MALESEYFTEEEYRTVTGDINEPLKAESTDLERLQLEVVNRLETWARTAWKVRTGRVEIVRRRVPLILTERVPINAITHIKFNGTAQNLADFDIDYEAGIIRLGAWSLELPLITPVYDAAPLIEVKYDFGFAGAPWPIKRPVIQACETLIEGEEGNSKIPRNALRYSSERTDVTLGRRGAGKPFPWDSRSSDDIRAYWEPRRPKGWIKTAV